MSDDEQPIPSPDPRYHLDRPSSRTEDRREAHFQAWLIKKRPYDAAIEAAGDVPWHAGDIESRRALFMRRYKTTPKENNQA